MTDNTPDHPRWTPVTDPPTMSVTGTVRDCFFGLSAQRQHRYCRIVVAVPHVNKNGNAIDILYPITYWEGCIPDGIEKGDRVTAEFRVTTATAPNKAILVRLRGHICRILEKGTASQK